ncbi:MAG: tRNA lysidine(34) synthetase TilS [Phycisphaeraceae bacterium]|nr:MAG: tRNA lysidine(34) synthetase TilS [Phycisphaeraceae bacterium]
MPRRAQAARAGTPPLRKGKAIADAGRPNTSSPLSIRVRRHPLITAFAKALHGPCGVTPGSRVVLGVSGGADSSSLLLAAATLAQRKSSRIQPIVVHVHHHLRREADDDEAFVRDLAARFELPFAAAHVRLERRIGGRSRPNSTNLLALARRRRYAALARVAREHDACAVATAHHLDDQCETVLMHLFRGCDLDGLVGMPWRRNLATGVSLIRPLLGVRRAACEELCRAAGVTWRDDPSNRDANRARAMLRHSIMPRIETLWPGAAEHVAATAQAVGAWRRSMDESVRRLFGEASCASWSRAALAAAPPAIVMAGLRRTAATMNAAAAPTRRHLDAAAEAIADVQRRPRSFNWPGNLQLSITSKHVMLRVEKLDR